MITLAVAEIGNKFIIQKINLSEEDIYHLESIGITLNQEIIIKGKYIINEFPCIIVMVNNKTIMLNSKYANQIYGEVLTKHKVLTKTR